jgi:hypothetical protein
METGEVHIFLPCWLRRISWRRLAWLVLSGLSQVLQHEGHLLVSF